MGRMRRPAARSAIVALLAALLLAACGPGAGEGTPPAASTATIDSSDEAAQLVIASDPRLAAMELGPRDPELTGGCCWYEAKAVEGGYEVVIVVGWGDCPSGCINEHRWTYAVTANGEVTPSGESGDPVPPGPLPPADGI